MADKEARLIVKIMTTGVEALSSIREGLTTIGSWAVKAGAAIVGFGAAAIAAFKESEQASNRLDQALANQGIYSKQLADSYKGMAAELQKITTYDDDAIVGAQASIQAYLGQTKVTKELTETILDFATAQGVDLDTAAKAIGKTIGTNTNVLSRYGISVSETASEHEKLAQVMQQVNDKFGGAARAQGQGLGALDQLKNAAGDFMEEVGARLAPAVTILAKVFTSFTESLTQNSQLMSNIKSAMEGVVIAGSVLKNVFFGLSEILGQVLGTALGAISQLLEGKFKQAWTTITDSAVGSADTVTMRWNTAQEEIATITQAFATKQEEIEAAKLQRLTQINQTAHEAKKAQMQEHDAEIAELKAFSDETLALKSLQAQETRINDEILNEQDKTKRLELELKKRKLNQDISDQQYRNSQTALLMFNKWVNDNHIKDKQAVFAQIATLTQSSNQTLVAIGRAAALAQISISTAEGVARALGAFPPPFNYAAAAAVGAAGAVQAAQVMGVRLAEGGIVKATPGGVQAIIGEGGRDEAVIPLNDDNRGLGTTNINITVNGGLLGDASSARELALAIDQELYKLKRNNESMLAA